MKDPRLVPEAITETTARCRSVGHRPGKPVSHHLEERAVEHGGGFGEGNWIEFPQALTGIDATIVGIVGNWFPTGAHKVGAAYGCLVPRLVTGNFDPDTQKAVWPSTGNYCRGGAYDCALLACPAIAILPEGMSRERFEWLQGNRYRRDHRDARHRIERQGNLRQVLGAARRARRRHRCLQPVRGIRQRDLALPDDRLAHRGDLREPL